MEKVQKIDLGGEQDLVHPYHTDPYQLKQKIQKERHKACLGQWSWGQDSKDQKLDPNGLAYWNDMGEQRYN